MTRIRFVLVVLLASTALGSLVTALVLKSLNWDINAAFFVLVAFGASMVADSFARILAAVERGDSLVPSEDEPERG